MRISVVIPVYNERRYIADILTRVQAVDIDKEIIVIDDASTDGTREFLSDVAEAHRTSSVFTGGGAALAVNNITVLFQERNRGKGAALRRGFAAATADVILV